MNERYDSMSEYDPYGSHGVTPENTPTRGVSGGRGFLIHWEGHNIVKPFYPERDKPLGATPELVLHAVNMRLRFLQQTADASDNIRDAIEAIELGVRALLVDQNTRRLRALEKAGEEGANTTSELAPAPAPAPAPAITEGESMSYAEWLMSQHASPTSPVKGELQ